MKSIAKTVSVVLLILIIVSAFNIAASAASVEAVELSADNITTSPYTSHRETTMNALERSIYNELKANIISVANGSLSSTQFTITSDISSLSWTQEELGCAIKENSSISSEAKDALQEKFNEALDLSFIHYCLLADLPYDLFWYDKTKGYSWNYTIRGNSSELWITSLTISFAVSEDYRSSLALYTVSSQEITQARNAAARAKEIVAKYAGKSDLERLQGYKEEICSLVSYNTAASESSLAGNAIYGDPWQLVYVFDGDPNTNVVCEGYSKAFKYLCDLSSFDNDIYCYIVNGTVTNGKSSERHMWNIVQIDGANYLVDITNSDSSYDIFLTGGAVSNTGKTYTVYIDGKNPLEYTYNESQLNIHGTDYLVLSETPYLDSYHEHNFSAKWVSDGTQHWHECSCGQKIDESTHSSTTRPETCTQMATCDKCGLQYGELPPHSYVQQITNQTYLKSSSTCTTQAVYYYSCQCGAKGTETFTVTGFVTHKFTQKNITPQALESVASCTKAATYYYSCSCGEIGKATFHVGEPIGHTYSEQNIEDRYLKSLATCTDSAVYYYSCSCGAQASTTFDYGTVLEHRYNELGECILCGHSIPISPPQDNESNGNNSEENITSPEASNPNTEEPSKDTTPDNNSVKNNSHPKYINKTLQDIAIVAFICVACWTLLIIFIKLSNKKKARKE